ILFKLFLSFVRDPYDARCRSVQVAADVSWRSLWPQRRSAPTPSAATSTVASQTESAESVPVLCPFGEISTCLRCRVRLNVSRSMERAKAAEDSRSPRRFARPGRCGRSARFWTAAVLCRFLLGQVNQTPERDDGEAPVL